MNSSQASVKSTMLARVIYPWYVMIWLRQQHAVAYHADVGVLKLVAFAID